MVQTNTVQGPGGEAGVMRIKGTGGASKVAGTQGVAELVAASTPEGVAALEADSRDDRKGDRGLAMALGRAMDGGRISIRSWGRCMLLPRLRAR